MADPAGAGLYQNSRETHLPEGKILCITGMAVRIKHRRKGYSLSILDVSFKLRRRVAKKSCLKRLDNHVISHGDCPPAKFFFPISIEVAVRFAVDERCENSLYKSQFIVAILAILKLWFCLSETCPDCL